MLGMHLVWLLGGSVLTLELVKVYVHVMLFLKAMLAGAACTRQGVCQG